jgi:streptogramin lyase
VPGNTAPQGIAIDGAGNVWTSNYYGDSITELIGSSATMVSPALGFGLDASLSEPYGIAIDASGNLWISNAGNSTVTQFVGLATPVQTPLLGPPSAP